MTRNLPGEGVIVTPSGAGGDMARLGLTLLGGFEARLASDPAVSLPGKAQALLAYLALRSGQAHPRSKLAALLWADSAEPHARASPRQTLSTLGRALAGVTPASLVTGDHTVVLDPAAADVDVAAFERAVAEGTPEALERAATLYRGDGLELRREPCVIGCRQQRPGRHSSRERHEPAGRGEEGT